MAEPAEQRVSLDQALDLATKLQQQGRLDEARSIYEQVLIKLPHQQRALSMLASISYQQGDDLQAEAYLDRLIQILLGQVEESPDAIGPRAAAVNLLLARGRNVEAETLISDLKLPLNPIRATPELFGRKRDDAKARGLPGMIINTMPKSASESIWNKLAQGLGMAQSHLSIGLFPECCLIPFRLARVAEGGIIAKEHIPASAHNLKLLEEHGLTRMVVHLRDPRQAMLSWVHFVRDDVSMRLMAPIWRRTVPPAHIVKGPLDETVDWCIEHYLPILVDFIDGWRRVAADPQSPFQARFLTFEKFRTEPEAYFDEALDILGAPKAGFRAEAQAETVHLRKGALDEWREVLDKQRQAAAWKQIPADMAEQFGWEK
ncbi:MAG: tetratricopeptide repeat protein [Rhodovibrionaceae bacterium]|nr:tetratricopeptide repeat protein [Rhodovibrionaceae bacterium]